MDPYGVIRFRRWTHEEVNRFHYLPFLKKLSDRQTLDEEEKGKWFAFQSEMITDALVEPQRFSEALNDPSFVEPIFSLIAYISGVDEQFDRMMSGFMDGELGFAYGYLWFTLLKRTPSEIGRLPETDVKTIRAWLSRWAGRMSKLA